MVLRVKRSTGSSERGIAATKLGFRDSPDSTTLRVRKSGTVPFAPYHIVTVNIMRAAA